MTDERRRDLERAASLDPTAEAAALRQRVRLGGDDAERVKLAAALGHPPARDAVEPWSHTHLAAEWQTATRDLLARHLLSGAAPAPLLPPGAWDALPSPATLDQTAWSSFRELFRTLQSADSDATCPALRAWSSANHGVRAARTPLRELTAEAQPADLVTLYAIGRVVDSVVSRVHSDAIDLLDLQAFLSGVGLTPFVHPVFHPVFHEVYAVVVSDDAAEPPAIVDVRWPGAMFGDLLVLRSGVVARAGRSWLDPAASSSSMYFTYVRGGRRANDRSKGWGSNSQWNTALRRDYVTADAISLNVDGREELVDGFVGSPPANDGLTLEERRELIAHRCFVRAPRAVPFERYVEPPEQYPYGWSLTLERGALPKGSRVADEIARGSGWLPLR